MLHHLLLNLTPWKELNILSNFSSAGVSSNTSGFFCKDNILEGLFFVDLQMPRF